MFVVDDTVVGVFHIDGEFFAVTNECAHDLTSLAHVLIESNTIRCRIHHWRFNIKDGMSSDRDQPESEAKTIPVRILGDDVQVDVDHYDNDQSRRATSDSRPRDEEQGGCGASISVLLNHLKTSHSTIGFHDSTLMNPICEFTKTDFVSSLPQAKVGETLESQFANKCLSNKLLEL